MLNGDEIPIIQLSTKIFGADFIENKRCLKKLEIFPDGVKWTFSKLLCFLNEQRTFRNVNHSYENKEDEDFRDANFKFSDNEN